MQFSHTFACSSRFIIPNKNKGEPVSPRQEIRSPIPSLILSIVGRTRRHATVSDNRTQLINTSISSTRSKVAFKVRRNYQSPEIPHDYHA